MCDLAVRERVADVGGDGADDREREPVGVSVADAGGNGHVARRAGHEDRRDQRQRCRDEHQHHDVMRLVLAVVGEQNAERAAPNPLLLPLGHGCAREDSNLRPAD